MGGTAVISSQFKDEMTFFVLNFKLEPKLKEVII